MVSVIIVNYNTFHLTCNCLRSVIATTKNADYEIILVDNASTECDPGSFLHEFPLLKLVKSPVNGGFADGNNRGIAVARGEFILLLNSDTILEEDVVGKSLQRIKADDSIGVLGCRMTFPDGKLQYTARRFRSISWELLDLFRFIPYLMSYRQRSGKMLGKYFRHDEDVSPDWLNGAFLLIPGKVIKLLPGQKLDDRFFMYGEDQLWCEQISTLGYKVHFYAGATIIHINSGSTDPSKQLRLRKVMMNHELEIMRSRVGSGLYYVLFKILFVGKEAARNLVKSVVYRLSGRLMR